MPNKKTIIMFLSIILCVAIVISVVIISNNLNKQRSSNSKDSATTQSISNKSSSSSNDVTVPISSDDSGEIKNKKDEDSLEVAGINPKKEKTPEEDYEYHYKIILGTIEDILKECKSNDYKDLPEFKRKYELNIKRKEYLEKVHNDFKSGKISLEEANKSLSDYYILYK
jgi:uncharacterized membrane protein